jgi:hypothetical protein
VPSATAKRDVSLLWPICPLCGKRHRGSAGCPKAGIWLVASICPKCSPRRYCTAHDCHVR